VKRGRRAGRKFLPLQRKIDSVQQIGLFVSFDQKADRARSWLELKRNLFEIMLQNLDHWIRRPETLDVDEGLKGMAALV
jgi:hypothetical protein